MVSETVNAIFGAEKANAEKTAEAKLKAAEIIAEAEAEAKKISEKIIQDAKNRARVTEENARKKAAELSDNDGDSEEENYSADKSRYGAAVKAVKAKAIE